MGQYRVYLRRGQQVEAESKTTTSNKIAASTAFAALINRTDLDGEKVSAVLSYNAAQLAFHRFDTSSGHASNWRGRLDDIEWPDAPAAHGGARTGTGPKVQTGDGGQLLRKNVSLDETTITRLTQLGDGELSEGIRRAARMIVLD